MLEKIIKTKNNKFKITWYVFCFSIIFFSSSLDISAATISKTLKRPLNNLGLVGYWTFDANDMVSNVRDSSGQGNNGFLSGQTSTTTIPGKIGQAISLDGVDDVVIVPISSSLDIPTTVTACAWVRPPNLPSSEAIMLSNANLDTDFTSQYSFEYEADGSVALFWSPGGGNFFFIGSSQPAITTLNVWYHLCIVRNSSSAGTAYVNGSAVPTTINSGAIPTSGFGSFAFVSGKGPTDDVRIYNRALSTSEISQLYNLGVSSKTSKSIIGGDRLLNGLIGYWTFDGNKMSPNVLDSSGQGNNGNLFGQTSTTTAPGKIGQTLGFDGLNDYVQVPNLTSPSSGTFSAWVKSDFNEVTCCSSFPMLFVSSDPRTSVWYNGSSDAYILSTNNSFTDRATYPVFADIVGWWHITVTWSANGSQFYRDGVAVGTTGTGDNSGASGNTFYLGTRPALDRWWSGNMDDVRLYNRVLSSSEISEIYNLGVASKTSKSIVGGDQLSSGLIGYWTFDGNKMSPNVLDSSGQGNNGNLSGQTSTTTTPGKIGQALVFDGTDDRVQTSLNFSGLTDFTVSQWVYVDSHSNSKTLWSNDNAAAGCTGEGLYLRDSSGIRFRVAGVEQTVTVPNLTGKWTHVVSTYNASNRRVYFDTTSVYNQVGGSSTNGDVGFQIGGYNGCIGGAYFDGNIDDVRVYNRVLSDAEIVRLYNIGR